MGRDEREGVRRIVFGINAEDLVEGRMHAR